MSSKYFSIPSFSRAKHPPENLEPSTSQEPILKEEDQQFLDEHVSNDEPPSGLQDVAATKISDDGEEKDTSMSEQIQADHATDQAVVPETQPPADGETQDKSYDDIMKEKAAERVQARKAKRKTLELPSQAEAEAATRGFSVDAPVGEAAGQPQNEKRTWTSFLQSMLPTTTTSSAKPADAQQGTSTEDSSSQQQTWKEYASSYIPPIPSSWRPSSRDKDRPQSPVYNEDGTIDQTATREDEKREVSALLDKLSLSQMNNRVFSFSTDTQQIYERFAQVLKDTINGGPTAYEDMEKLMREAGPKLEQQFKSMPPFVQTLVKSLPARIGTTLGPEFLAAASEKPGADMKARLESASRPGTADSGINIPSIDSKEKEEEKKSGKKKRRIPGLKTLLSKEGAVASMLRNVVNFLQTRFPFLASTTNVAMSLAVFSMFHVLPFFKSK